MTRIKKIGHNMTLMVRASAVILFSYETPVAVYDMNERVFYKTEVKYSRTTSRHINKWLDGADAKIVPQESIESYCY